MGQFRFDWWVNFPDLSVPEARFIEYSHVSCPVETKIIIKKSQEPGSNQRPIGNHDTLQPTALPLSYLEHMSLAYFSFFMLLEQFEGHRDCNFRI
jgi:hypothetical protein